GGRGKRVALQVVFREVDHHRNRLFDGGDVLARFVGGIRSERQIEGVGGDETGGERLARLSERRQQQRVARADGALDDRIEARHFPCRLEHFVLVGMGEGGLKRAHLAKTLQQSLGYRTQLVRGSRQNRVHRAAAAPRT